MNSTDVYEIPSTIMASTSDLDIVNDRMATILIPVMLVISVYMIIGLFGNTLLVYYYGCVVTSSPSYNFIVTMAIFDIIICCVSMPLEIIDLRYKYEFPSVAACKIFRFVNYFASISSGFVLNAVAIDRYRKVCEPFKGQITLKMAKIIIVVACIFSFCVSWPSFAIYDIHKVNISSVPGLIGYDCTTIRNKEYKLYILIYNGLCFVLFIACITSLTVLYILIGRKLFLLKRLEFSMKRKKLTKSAPSQTSATTEINWQINQDDHVSKDDRITTTAEVKMVSHDHLSKTLENELHGVNKAEIFHDETGKLKLNQDDHVSKDGLITTAAEVKTASSETLENELHGVNKAEIFHDETGKLKETIIKTDMLEILDHSDIYSDTEEDVPKGTRSLHKKRKKNIKNSKNKTKNHQQINLNKYSLLMFCVTLAFVLSFLPYLGLMTWRTLAPKYEVDLMSESELVLYNIFFRSWLLSSVINPFIYGFFNYDFSHFIVSRFRKICCCWRIREFHRKRMKEYSDAI